MVHVLWTADLAYPKILVWLKGASYIFLLSRGNVSWLRCQLLRVR